MVPNGLNLERACGGLPICEPRAPAGKEGNVSRRSFTLGVIAGLMLWTWASVASAQTASAAAQTASQSSTEDWQFELVPYLWGSAIDGEVGIGNRTANIDAPFS